MSRGAFPRIPGFEIVDRIGFGGFATVYQARQPGLDRTVAIKVVHRSRAADDETLRRFRRECQAIGSLTGTPGVMTVFDLGTTADGDPYLVLEFLDGGSLQELLEREGPFGWQEVVDVARSLSVALAAAHDLGILHRDVKPANVLLDRYGNVRLGDFGIAHLAGSSESTAGDTAMTVSYAAPEMLMGKRATAASDYYSLGALMYTLLRGRSPFSQPHDDSVAAVIKRITSDPVPPLKPGAVPGPVETVIVDLMAKDPSRRPSGRPLTDRLEALLGSTSRPRGLERKPVDRGAERTRSRPAAPGGTGAGVSGVPPRTVQPSNPAARSRPTFTSGTVHRSQPGAPTGPGVFTTGGRYGKPRGPVSVSGGLSGPLSRAVFDSGPGKAGVYGGLGYAVDIVFVIDTTASMWPVLAQVKHHALGFHGGLISTMAAKGKHVSKLRVRLVAYRDFLDLPDDGLIQSGFLELPAQQDVYRLQVGSLTADGGGDEPESGLEGLAVAITSSWERGMDRRRHVIVLCTDASAHPLEAAAGRLIPGYPAGIPRSFDELTDLWDDPGGAAIDAAAKRLLLYAPDVYPWNVISRHWDGVLHFPSRAGEGLNEVDFTQIIQAIAGSV